MAFISRVPQKKNISWATSVLEASEASAHTHRNKAELLLSGDSFRFPLRRRIENLSSNLTIRMFWTSSFLFRRAGIILSRQRTALIEILQVISVRELDSDVEENSRHVLQQGSWWNFTEWNYKSSVKLSVEKGMERELQTYFLMLRLNFRLEIRKNFLQITWNAKGF